MNPMKIISVILCFCILQTSLICSAWGIRGHLSLCEAAAKLVQHPQLLEYLSANSSRIGYICDIPDLQWRFMSQNFKEHLLRPENIGLTLEQLPLDYKIIQQNHPGTIKSLGSNWWRAEQFYRRAVALKPEFSGSALQANQAALDFLLNLGYMGHFIGDLSQPLHSTADNDGYAAGHGGIHLYYEEWVVDFISGNLPEKILQTAKEKRQRKDRREDRYLTEPTLLKKARALSILSHQEQPLVLAMDPIVKPSSQGVHGMSFPAKRKWASFAVQNYEPLILNQLARSALLLAQLWDQAYEEVGTPDFSKMKPNSLPLVFSYVIPDYL
jgi:zinc dependent phospholipase C